MRCATLQIAYFQPWKRLEIIFKLNICQAPLEKKSLRACLISGLIVLVWGVQVRLAIPDIHAVIDRAVATTLSHRPSSSALHQEKGYVREQEAGDGCAAAPTATGAAASLVVTDDFVDRACGFKPL